MLSIPANYDKGPDLNSAKFGTGVTEHSNRSDQMDSVFILWHSHEVEDESDKLIGVYKTRGDAEAAIQRLKDKPGFKGAVDDFAIHEYVLGRDGWTEGYVS